MATELLIDVSSADPNDPTVKVVRFTGSLDATNLEQAEAVVDEQLLPGTVKKLVFDFSALEYLNSRAVGFLVSLSQKAAAAHAVLILAGLKPNVEDIITIVGLNQIIPVVKSVEEAKYVGEDGRLPG